MKISSSFTDNSFIPTKHSRNGGDISPPIIIEDAPVDTVSFVLICQDIDASQKDGWNHWLVWNIPKDTKNIPESSLPIGSKCGTTDWGENRWGGPQPPSGTHRYVFTVYALDTILDLPESSTRTDVLKAIEKHTLTTANLTGLYSV